MISYNIDLFSGLIDFYFDGFFLLWSDTDYQYAQKLELSLYKATDKNNIFYIDDSSVIISQSVRFLIKLHQSSFSVKMKDSEELDQ